MNAPNASTAVKLMQERFPDLSLPDRIAMARYLIEGPVVFTTSLGLEDQVITWAIAQSGAAVTIATLDTGRLFPETVELWAETEDRFGLRITAVLPDGPTLAAHLDAQGPTAFRRSVALRKACCGIRKIEPLSRALAGAHGWITGLRADQSEAREGTPFAAFDEERGLIKINPLQDWSRARAAALAAAERIPVNPLHEQGYLSIGCAPCTRAVQPGEPERAGRWWWEQDGVRECGLHPGPDGRLHAIRPGVVA